jgi:inner membrane protein
VPTILTHPAVPLALGLGLGGNLIPRRLLAAGVVASIVPDLDVLAFQFGVPYGSALGHRGFTHSIAFAAALALIGALAARPLRTSIATAFLFVFAAAGSHGALDSFTNGGSGIAFLWPWSATRFFAPFQLIEVSPIGVSRFLSARGLVVLASELRWVWLPAVVLAAALAIARRAAFRSTPGERNGRPPP